MIWPKDMYQSFCVTPRWFEVSSNLNNDVVDQIIINIGERTSNKESKCNSGSTANRFLISNVTVLH
jgi:hypothetical protein